MKPLAVILIFLAASKGYAENCFEAVNDENLTNYCLINKINLKTLNPVYLPTIDLRLKRAGYLSGLGYSPENKRSYFNSIVSIGVYRERNLNGGNPKGDLILQNLIYRGEKEKELRSDTVVSPLVSINGRFIYGEGRHVNLGLRVSDSIGLKTSLRNNIIRSHLCLDHHIIDWNYLKICTTANQDRKKFQEENATAKEIGYNKVGKFNDSYYSVKLTGLNYKVNGLNQRRVKYGASVLTSYGFTSVDITHGEGKEGNLLLKKQVDFAQTKVILGKKMTFGYSIRDSEGGVLLGVKYGEKTSSQYLAVNIHENWSISISTTKNKSKINYFDYSDSGISLRYLKSLI